MKTVNSALLIAGSALALLLMLPIKHSSADNLSLVKEAQVDGNWYWIEDYLVPFGRDMSVQCEPGRQCEIATGVAAFGGVGASNRGAFSGNKQFSIGPAGAVYFRMVDGRGPGKMRYYAGKIGTHDWHF